MDPLSVSASVITLLAAATTSCRALSSLYHETSRATENASASSALFHALLSHFAQLEVICRALPASSIVMLELHQRLCVFLRDIKNDALAIESVRKEMTRSRVRRTLANIKWTTTTHDRSEKFLEKLHAWNVIFSNNLQVIQMSVCFFRSHRDITLTCG
jgi:hypothetical protein